MRANIPPQHPGEILVEKFLEPLGITQLNLSKDLNISIRRIHEICRGKRGMTPETAFRLSIYFHMSPEFWLMLQQQYELELLRQKDAVRLKREVRPFSGSVQGGSSKITVEKMFDKNFTN